jgi:hypothetical protein
MDLTFQVNGQVVGSASTTLVSEGMIGLYVGMQPGSPAGEVAEVAFSNLIVAALT